MSSPSASRPHGTASLAATGLALAYGVGTLVVLVDRDPRATSYFTASAVGVWAGLTAGLGLLLVGVVAAWVGPRGVVGWLAVVCGALWLAPVWVGWETGPDVVRAAAALAVPLLAPVLLHLAFLSPRGRLPSGNEGRMVAVCYAAFLALVVLRALVREPLRDPSCWVHCGRSAGVFVVWSNPTLGQALGVAVLALTVTVAAICAVDVSNRLRARRLRPPVLTLRLFALLALVGEAAYAVVLLAEPVERFSGDAGSALFLLRSASLVGVAVGTGWWAASHRIIRRRMARLALELGESPGPGELEAALAGSLRDESLTVHYWLPRAGRFVDSSGRTAEVDPADRRVRVTVVRGAEPVAVILHDPERVARDALGEGFGAAARLVVDNERLRAETLAQLRELRESRARIVAASDAHRVSLERDLHDGAQQRLIAALFEVRLAAAEAEAAGDTELCAQLDQLISDLMASLTDLREFAHGIFPAVLDESGVAEALWSLTDTASTAVEFKCRLDRRLPAEIERTVYLLVKAALEAPAPGPGLEVRVSEEDQEVVVEVRGTGCVDFGHLSDRVGAVGGALNARDQVLRAVIPCAS